ncbi:nuclear transport factor 2 family protein [Arthrobacter sp. Marseille-P9274]|uniref:nuclear transport factor 2 family protein n=1 Tax=Arthrobacter sp. Marseille-P9274 TaxID=2866572 RepID=UPI0021C6FE5A|nr:nuclear transport factor 2 family protein [Arthrobacter sp. Marseille-P9274]
MTAAETTTAARSVETHVEAIRRLTHEYSWAVDNSRLDDIVALFTEDAEWDVTAFGMDTVRGADAIRAFYAGLIENTTHRCHLALNHLIDVDGDTAVARVYIHAFVTMPDGRRDESLGYYSDNYIRTGQGWKFQRRAAYPLLPAPPAPV